MPITVPDDFPVWVPDGDGHVRGRVHQVYRARTGGQRAVVRITVSGGQYRAGDHLTVPLRTIEPRTVAHRRPTRIERVLGLMKGLFA